jgi:hypothetical protein
MQIPILSGVYTDSDADYRIAYPVNMRPIVKDTGISAGYLRPIDGIVKTGEGPGKSRGAINWEGRHYRVMGSKLCVIGENNSVAVLGDVEDDGKQVSFAYSFDRLAIASNKKLFYLRNNTLQEVTDPDLGDVLDVIWIDGYFMTTDGGFLVVTELSDPASVNPLKYTASEIDPDPIVAIVKQRNEVYAINRYTIEVFTNTGGALFPFGRINGAQIQRGALGTHCAMPYEESIVFLGSGPGESPGIYIAGAGQSSKISSREVDDILDNYTEEQLSEVVFEVVNDRGHALLWVRLPDRTLVFDLASTKAAEKPVWYIMTSSASDTFALYRGVDVIWCYDNWQVGDAVSANIGILDDSVSTHFGDEVYWEFSTAIVYGEGSGAVFHSVELVALPGRVAFEEDAYVTTSYSVDGQNWSQQRPLFIGERGNRTKRLIWRRQGNMRNFRIQKFTGDSKAYLAVARLEAQIEGLIA